jgi:glycerophosphoryl diester phosphodiesterase
MTKPLIIAHRGASALAPENTRAAFRLAVEGGAEGIEFDVQAARDGVPVVIHDFDLKRLAGRAGRVSDHASAELRNFDVGSWFNLKNPRRADERFAAERIPTFVELLDFLADFKGLLYVELKCAASDFAPLVETVCQTIRASEFLPQIRLKSFNLEAIRHAKRIFPEIRTVALFEPKIGALVRGKAHLVETAETAAADELSLHYSLATPKMMRLAAAKNFPVAIWTVDNPMWIGRARNLGVEAVITNHPARLIEQKLKAKSEI